MEDLYIELDQPRRLRINLKSSKVLSRLCESGLIDIDRKLRSLDIDTLERVLYVAMLEDEPALTLNLTTKRVESYFDREKTLTPLVTAALQALEASGIFNSKTETAPGNGKATTTPTQ